MNSMYKLLYAYFWMVTEGVSSGRYTEATECFLTLPGDMLDEFNDFVDGQRYKVDE